MGYEKKETYIAGLDVGTTFVRCHIINSKAESISTSAVPIKLIYPKQGYVEINPEDLWNDVCYVIKTAILDANLEASQISSLGISTQRATFITWRKDDGRPFHNFITWKDLRADLLVQQWNKALAMKVFRGLCYGMYIVSRNKLFLAASSLKLSNTQITLKLLWVIENLPEVKLNLSNKNVMFGTVDTWLIHKFTSGSKYITDITNASATGFYNPFILNWASWTKHVLNFPLDILPEVVDNDYNFGTIDKRIFGSRIALKCVVSDQSASMFGSCCFNSGDTKITLGTGSFLNVNTKDKVHGSASGLYPLVGWKLKNKATYIVEGACNDTGSLILWAIKTGLISTPSESTSMADSVENTDGVYFIPAFSGLGPPIMDDNAASGFIGLKATNTKAHMMRAILESIAFRIALLYNMVIQETRFSIKQICVDGGVSNNDFLCQFLANLLSVEIHRSTSTEMSALGAVFMTGLNAGVWKSKEELKQLITTKHVFRPSLDYSVIKKCKRAFDTWIKAVDRFKSWY